MSASRDLGVPRPGWTALLLALLTVLVLVREQTPAPSPVDVPTTQFSAERAAADIAALVPDSRPHPVGSVENLAVRDRLVQLMRDAGLEPELTQRVACRPQLRCGVVRNVMARIPGQTDGPAVLLASHYDSVPAGPGVGDDLSGVSVALETARAILAGPRPRRPVWILIDDGEEQGLLGARAFTDDPELVAGVGVVVNVEARGSGGLSRMFETSGPNAWMVGVAAGAVPRPSMTSLHVEVYRRLPNDTDLTVFREAGLPGLNHAFIRNVRHYHTPLDDLQHLDRGTLQHEGDTVLATVLALANAPELVTAETDAVYSDVVGLFVISWPQPWTTPLALLAFLMSLAASVVAVRRGHATARAIGAGFGAAVAVMLGSGVAAFAIGKGISGVAGTGTPPVSVPIWALLCLACVVTLVTVAVAAPLGRGRAVAAAAGVWILWSALGLAMAVIAPGVSILFVPPALVGGTALLVSLASSRGMHVAVALGVIASALLVGSLTVGLFEAFGFGRFALLAVPLALVATTALPGLCPDRAADLRRPGLGVGLLGLAMFVAAALSPLLTAEQPGVLNLLRVEDQVRGTAMWYAESGAGELPLEGFEPGTVRGPGLGRRVHEKVAAPSPRQGARLEAVSGRPGTYRLTSARGSTWVGLAFPVGVTPERISVETRPVAPTRTPWFDGTERSYFEVVGLPVDGVELEVRGAAGATVELMDVTYGLHGPDADALLEERPDFRRPRGSGDRDVVVTRQVL